MKNLLLVLAVIVCSFFSAYNADAQVVVNVRGRTVMYPRGTYYRQYYQPYYNPYYQPYYQSYYYPRYYYDYRSGPYGRYQYQYYYNNAGGRVDVGPVHVGW
jgi:hypothetical protein